MKGTFGFLVLFMVINSDLSVIRKAYSEAIYSEKKTEKLLDDLESITVQTPTLYAYKGATHAIYAKFLLNPSSKLEKVKKGTAMLDDAVIADSDNMEIRYLRYSIEKNIPSFLPYRKHIEQDEVRIINALIAGNDALSPEIRSEVIQYMLKNAQLSPENKRDLEKLVN